MAERIDGFVRRFARAAFDHGPQAQPGEDQADRDTHQQRQHGHTLERLLPVIGAVLFLAVLAAVQAPPVTVQAQSAPTSLSLAREWMARAAKRLQDSEPFKEFNAAKALVEQLEKEAKAKASPPSGEESSHPAPALPPKD